MDQRQSHRNRRLPDLKRFNNEVKRFTVSDTKKAIWQICTSVIPYLVTWYLMVLSLETHYLVTLLLAFLAAGFLIRIFIIQHDCSHGSFFSTRKANKLVGAICGVITFTPFKRWKSSHIRHHATSSDLDFRGEGDVWTLTVDEYRQKTALGKMGYRLYRNPFVMFVFGGPYVTILRNRFPLFEKGVFVTNLAIAAVMTMIALAIGWKAVALVQLPILIIATNIGVWLFYVQHNFADTYWEKHDNWEYILAATDGASFYKLPRIFQWFSGNIGFHHLHHLNPRIPSYLLPEAHYSLPFMDSIPVMTFWTSLKTMNKALWDPNSKKLVSFKQAKSA